MITLEASKQSKKRCTTLSIQVPKMLTTTNDDSLPKLIVEQENGDFST
jgi:hypothetical protein